MYYFYGLSEEAQVIPPLVLLDKVQDSGLGYLATNANRIYLCTDVPASYAEATSGGKSLGYGTASFGAVGAGTPNGRQTVSAAVSAGNISASGLAAAWAAVNSVGSELLAYGELADPKVVNSGEKFNLDTFTITCPAS